MSYAGRPLLHPRPSALFQMGRTALIEAIYALKGEFDRRTARVDGLFVEAKDLIRVGLYTEAEQKLTELLELERTSKAAWRALSEVYCAVGRYDDGLNALVQALKINPVEAIDHYRFGAALGQVANPQQAIRKYREALVFPSDTQNGSNMYGGHPSVDGLFSMEAFYRRAASSEGGYESFLYLGNILLAQHKIAAAIEAYKAALRLRRNDRVILTNIGTAYELGEDPIRASLYFGLGLFHRARYQDASAQIRRYLNACSGKPNVYVVLADCHLRLNELEQAAEVCREGISLYPTSAGLHSTLTRALQRMGKTEEAIAVAGEALKMLPHDLTLKQKFFLTLPIIYHDQKEVDFYRHRFAKNLDRLAGEVSLRTPEERENALKMLGSSTNFYLAYQGETDLNLQVKYGWLAHQIMAANYPEWSRPKPTPTMDHQSKIRVGYASDCFYHHSIANTTLGWLRYADRRQFEIYCYYLGERSDYMTEQFRRHSCRFRHLTDLPTVCKQIVADRLHVLIYPDIGMDPKTTQMAALRLAPVQCAGFGHSVTSGLPTIDYFLSSVLMEPEDGEEHYSERLIRLPNIGVCYEKPDLPKVRKSRGNLGIPEDRVVFLCWQSLFKYLPRYDYLLAKIAGQVPSALFLFSGNNLSTMKERLFNRLRRAFAEVGLDIEKHCRFLPEQDYPSYLSLYLVSDVFLDTLGWSGGNTTLEAIACGLPVVTCPSKYMRGRQSYAFLKMLGVTETIASDEAGYIAIAVRLGLDPEWRRTISEAMMRQHSQLFDDKTCVTALEDFYRRAVSVA